MSRRWRRKVSRLYPYVVQVGGNKEVLYVNYTVSVGKAMRSFKYRHPQIRNSTLRKDLFDSEMYFTSTKRADRGSRQLIRRLEEAGYEVIAGGPLHNNFWQVYVIEIDGDENHLYVGETNYPVEKRFQQHVYKFNPARVLLKYDTFELAMEHAQHLPFYRSKEESLTAEETLAEELRKKGFVVEGGH